MHTFENHQRLMFSTISNSKHFIALTKDIKDLNQEFDQRTIRKEYSRCNSTEGGYYQKVPYRKLWVTNIDLGRKLKKQPKTLDEVFVHDFDSNNNLIRTTYYYLANEEYLHFIEFFFREGNVEWSFVFYDNIYVNAITRVTRSEYDQDGKLISYGTTHCLSLSIKELLQMKSAYAPKPAYYMYFYILDYQHNRVDIITEYHSNLQFATKRKRIKVEYDPEGFVVGSSFIEDDGSISSSNPTKKKYKFWY